MSKELTPLEALEDIILYLNASEPKGLYCKNIEILKTALKRLEELEIVNSEQFKEKCVQDNLAMTFELNVANKKLKAFEIIKRKNVNVYNFVWHHEHHKWLNYEEYCKILSLPEEEGCVDTFELQEFCKCGERLNQEEFELLKEVLL